MSEQRTKGTWLMSYADLFTLLLTAFLLSVVLINELQNTLFITVDLLIAEGVQYLDGSNIESYTDKNKNGEYDKGEPYIDCDIKYNLCSNDSGWTQNMGNDKYDQITLDGKIDNKSEKLKIDVERPIDIKKGTKGIQLIIPTDKIFISGLAEIEQEATQELCLVGKIVFDAIKLNYFNVENKKDSIITYYTIDSLRQDLGFQCQKIIEKIRVEGHTDNTPITKKLATKWYNQTNSRLSSARALSVVEFWLSNKCDKYQMPNKLEEKWFTTVGIGEHSPIASNLTPEGREKNRRVEIFIDVDIELDSTIMVNVEEENITCKDYIMKKEKNKRLEEKKKKENIFIKAFKYITQE